MTSPPPTRSFADRLLRPTLGELWTFLAVALPVLAALIASLPTVDLAYQLRAGAEILAGQGIPSVDTWTFTAAGLPWFDQQWGAQAVLAAIHAAAGWTGLALLRAALVGLGSALILVAIRARAPGMRPRTAALLSLAAFVVTAPAMALRPQLLGMALFALVLAAVATRRRHPLAVWLVPVIAIAWANVHGSFILAPLLVGLAWLEDVVDGAPRARWTLFATAVTAAATLVNPFGPGVWAYALGLATNRQVTAQISEWQPPSITNPTGFLFWVSVLLVVVVAAQLARGRVRTTWPQLLALVVFAALGAVAARGVAWWPGVAVVAVAGLSSQHGTDAPAIGRAEMTRIPSGSRLNGIVGAVLLLAGVALLPTWRPVDPGLGAPTGLLGQAPPGITAALRTAATPGDRVWNPQIWGSWLEFAVPAPSYALDSRIEVIPAQVWADAAVVAAGGDGSSAIFSRAGVTIVITEGSSSALASALSRSADWVMSYADADGAIWIRQARPPNS